jgi:hypothetical protein
MRGEERERREAWIGRVDELSDETERERQWLADRAEWFDGSVVG